MPESTSRTRPPARDARGRWLRGGASPNPGGRRASIVPAIRAATGDGERIVLALVQVLDDQAAAARDRIASARTLLEWGWSRPLPDELAAELDERFTVAQIQRLVASYEHANGATP